MLRVVVVLAFLLLFSLNLVSYAQVVTVADVPLATTYQSPIGGAVAENLDLLNINSFINFHYPKIRFNENGNGVPDSNEWFVITAFNRNRYLHLGWDTEPASGNISLYSVRGDYHPGEDWNAIPTRPLWGLSDFNKPIYSIADGVVLYSGCGYGNTLILAHKTLDGELVTSLYAHMKDPSVFRKSQFVARGTEIGRIGTTAGANCRDVTPSHLHFEVRKESMIEVDPTTNEISLRYRASMWPAVHQRVNNDRGQIFISRNYYDPSQFLKLRSVPFGTVLMNATRNGLTYSGPVNYDIIGPNGTILSTAVPSQIASLPPGQYTLTYQNGGPADSLLTSVTPSITQTLSGSGSLTFTMNFSAMPVVTPTGCTFRPNSGGHFSAVDYSTPNVFSTNQSGATQSFQITVYTVDGLCNFDFAGSVSGSVAASHKIGVRFNAPRDFDYWNFTTNSQIGGHQTAPIGDKGYLVNVLQTTDPAGQSVFSESFNLE